MQYTTDKSVLAADCFILGIFENQKASAITLLSAEQQTSLDAFLNASAFDAKVGKTSLQYQMIGFNQPMVLIGLGDEGKYKMAQMRKALTAVGKTLVDSPFKNVSLEIPKPSDARSDSEFLRQAIICVEDANITRDQLKSKPVAFAWPSKLTFVGTFTEADAGVVQGASIAKAVKLCKQLANLAPNYCTPTYLADQAVKIGNSVKNVNVQILDKKAIEDLKMGCLLGVAQGSVQPPKFIIMNYQGAAKDQAPLVLVGKGITFDAGGISLKPGARMDEMRYDMGGAASVMSCMQAVAELALPINLVVLVPTTENLPSGGALKPGDILTSMSGKTVEVLNTDAEGRLILCDALTYAERFNPKAVIDVATLTGAIVVTLGSAASGLMANNQNVANALLAAGETSGDRTWQLPLWEEYQEIINTAFADVSNLGNDEAKSITAGCFLERFAEKYPWAHLDIAGTAWTGSGNMNRAATGRPVPLLMQYIFNSIT